jgi:hypothetical protein
MMHTTQCQRDHEQSEVTLDLGLIYEDRDDMGVLEPPYYGRI